MEIMVPELFIERSPLSEHSGSHTGEQGGGGGGAKTWRGKQRDFFNLFLLLLYSSFSSPCVMT